MSTRIVIYHDIAPDFPATDQHPNAVRYGPLTLDGATLFVDALGGQPDDDALRAVLNPPAPVPTISKAQALLYMLSIGKTEADVTAAIATIPDANARAVAQIEWDHREPFHHDNPFFVALAPALGIVDLAAAFRAAALL